jgi:hypothetical protein
MNCFCLIWFDNLDNFGIVGDVLMPSVTEDEVKQAFDISGEYPGDPLQVTEKQVEWLQNTTKCVKPDLTQFDYFVDYVLIEENGVSIQG